MSLTGQNSPLNMKIILSQNEKDLLSQQEIVVRDLSSGDGDGKTIEAVGVINASIDEVYRVLIHFEDYNKFMPNITQVEILEKNSNHAILGYTVELPTHKIKKYRLDMSYGRDENRAYLYWTMVAWPGLKESEKIRNTTGYWIIKNYPNHEESVVALYHVFTDPGDIPLGLGWIVDILTYYSVPTVLIKTKERVHFISN
jgi:hypothetical protein